MVTLYYHVSVCLHGHSIPGIINTEQAPSCLNAQSPHQFCVCEMSCAASFSSVYSPHHLSVVSADVGGFLICGSH